MIINTNVPALNTYRQMGINQSGAQNSMEKLASGLRINRAGDDAAGLAISEKMRAQIRGLDQASRNAQDGISMIQTAEGALQETHNILQRMRELAAQAANDTNVEVDRNEIQKEINQLTSEINRIGNTTEFNTQKILNGGIDQKQGQNIKQATNATVKGTVGFEATDLSDEGAFAKVTVGDTTFDLGKALSRDWTDMDGDGTNREGTIADIKNAISQVSSGGVKLTDVANIKIDGDKLSITAKAEGANSFVKVEVGTENTAKVLTFTNAKDGVTEARGTASTIEAHGLQANMALNEAKIAQAIGTGIIDDSEGGQAVITTGSIDVSGGTTGEEFNFSGDSAITFRINDREIVLDKDYDDFDELVEHVQRQVNEQFGPNVIEVTKEGTDQLKFNAFKDITLSGDIGATGINATASSAKAFDFSAAGAGSKSFTVETKIDGNDETATVTLDRHYGNLDEVLKAIQSQLDAEFGVDVIKAVANDTLTGFDTNGGFNLISEQKFEIASGGDEADLGLTAAAELDIVNVGNAVSERQIKAGSSFEVIVGNDSAVSVSLNEASYRVNDSDPNVVRAEMERMVIDMNAALQNAGLSGQVTASLSTDNKLQFISETGQNIKLRDGNNDPLKALGFDAPGKNVSKSLDKVVGPGAQGSGFNAKFQIGANTGQSIDLNIADMRASALGVSSTAGMKGFSAENNVTNGTTNVAAEAALNVMSHESATKAITVINDAIEKVSAERSNLGAIQNRLEHTISNLNNASENLSAAESRIRDVDMAREVMEMTKNNILSQASQAMLAQANQAPQSVLQLLG